MEPLPCWRCGKAPTVDPNGGYPTVACYDCYDGAEDSGRRYELGSGRNRAEAVAHWNEQMVELEEEHRCTFQDCKNRGQFDGRCYFHDEARREQAIARFRKVTP